MTQKQANLLLATVSIAWGLSYVFMKFGIDSIPPGTIVALRCGIAFLVTVLMFGKKMMKVSIQLLKYASISGALLGGIFAMLLYGVLNTSATTAGFMTSTTVVMVPLIQACHQRKFPAQNIIFGVVFISIGLALMTIQDGLTFDVGAIYCLVAALLYAIHIIVTNRFVKKVDPLQLGIYQLGFAAVYATLFTFLFEVPVLPNSSFHWFAILGLALICSAYGFVMQSVAQKYTTAESVGFLFSLEPIFSAIFAFIFLKEMVGFNSYIGALLIIIGVFVANRNKNKNIKQQRTQHAG
ncbi:DMT family transporter [Paenibacillus sp. Y412MC10]|uniref:DMT family transporter n=1 Tax=Geobacillus sp. (strain Y412MC10) TaxID=481743 RepID=UPI0011AB5269|nr:DMT family transporter [Paenibacillus sp. Y412MC10]